MTGNSDNNRSEGQGGCREALSTKEVCSKGTTVGKRTEQRGRARAMSVLGNAKSNRHRKTRTVEPDGTGRKFMHLTRGDLNREGGGEVSRGRSSEESRGNPEGAKGRRTKRQANRLTAASEQEAHRNRLGAATAATSRHGGGRELWWTPEKENAGMGEFGTVRKEVQEGDE